MKHILFGLNQNPDKKIEGQIFDKYQKMTEKEFTFDSEYYLAGIEKALSEKKYSTLIIREDLQANKQIPIKFLDNISDKYPELNVIIVVNNEHQGDRYVIDIFSLGIYNVLYKEDLTLGNVVKLIETSRTKIEAKIYLELEDITESHEEQESEEDVLEIPEEELVNILKSFRGATLDNISKMFDEVNEQYERRQMLFLVTLLPSEIKEAIRETENENYLKYEAQWNNKINKADREEQGKGKKKERFREKNIKIEKVIVEKEKIVKVEKKVFEKIYIEKEKEVKVYERPNDYKKKIGFVGHRGAGCTSLVCFVGDFLSRNKVKTAIVDLTKGKNLFDIYPLNRMESIDGDLTDEFEDSQALVSLVTGIIKPYKINKNLDLYTSYIESDVDISNPFYFIQLLEQEYDVILLDMDYDTPMDVYQIINTAYIVQTLDLSNVKNNTKYQLSLKNAINMKKIKYVINRTIPCAMQIKAIASCLKVYTDHAKSERTQLTEEDTKHFVVRSSDELLKMSYGMEYNYKKLEKEVLDAIKEIAIDIYPTNTNEDGGLLGKLSKFFKKEKGRVIKEEDLKKELETVKPNKREASQMEPLKSDICLEKQKAIEEILLDHQVKNEIEKLPIVNINQDEVVEKWEPKIEEKSKFVDDLIDDINVEDIDFVEDAHYVQE